ncbi:MAG TPA: caspase family protein [Usitatibacter sp.]|nr:caspase family protein [Usitatibacter sp.]
MPQPSKTLVRRAIHLVAAVACVCALGVAAATERVALLIGNNQYAATPLRNATNDAKDLSEALKELGFKVIVRENASRRDMIEAIREFGQALEGASTALFFYAGHAMQFKDRNYLIPIDAAMGSEEDVTFFSVEIGQVFDRMDRARTRFNFIILDACRDNPFAASFKTTSQGLAQMSSPSGTLIAYATAPGSVAADGYGRNGIYTKHILQNIRVPDLPVEIMFKRVREGVERETRRLQTPWDSSSLKGDFAFNTSAARPATAGAGPSGPSADITLQIEREFWISVRDSNRPEDIRAYLDKYPNGNFASLAKNRLDALVRPARSAAAEPAAPRDPSPELTAASPPPKVERPPVLAAAPASAPPSAPPSPAQIVPPASTPAAAATMPAAVPPRPAEAPLPGREVAPGVREVTFADGAIYRGGMRGANLHGKGEYVSKAFKYEGEFSEGLKHGRGVYVWDNGDRYDGKFTNDRPDGSGKYHFANGDSYEGEVKAGVIIGRGTYTAKGGDVFEGSFAGGKPHGVGVYRFASGDRYEGEMDQGRLQGRGRYIARSGDRIEAPFVDGKAQGVGVYHFSNGDRYEGEILAGELSGQGVYHYKSGLKYEGEVRGGQPQGKGVFWFQDGSRFEGRFENGLARARGEIVRPDGSRAAAEIVDGNARLLN